MITTANKQRRPTGNFRGASGATCGPYAMPPQDQYLTTATRLYPSAGSATEQKERTRHLTFSNTSVRWLFDC